MKFRIVEIPSFKAITSGIDKKFDFSESGVLGKFNTFFSKIVPSESEKFLPRDFLYYDLKNEGLVWIYAITENISTDEFKTIEFEGGIYLTYFYEDGDQKENELLYNEALKWINDSKYFQLDQRENHYSMGHIITPQAVIKATGISQMQSYIPIKLKD